MQKKDVVKTNMLGSLPRILDTLNCFYQRYHCWPTQLLLDEDMVSSIQEDNLTPEGWRAVEDHLLIKSAKGTVIAQDEQGQRFEYDATHIDPEGQHCSADYWLWGCSVWPEVKG